LCTATLNQLSRTLNALPESAGEAFDVIVVSFDPRDSAALAAAKKSTYLRGYRRSSAADGWRFLTAEEASIRRLTAAAGFRYAWDDEHQVFAHASGLLVVTPTGKISRYFLGVEYPPRDVRNALTSAAREETGPPTERVLFYCFRYDPSTGRYGLIIGRVLQAGGVLTMLVVASLITFYLVRERRQSRLAATPLAGKATD
jgi:protein SCO1/2